MKQKQKKKPAKVFSVTLVMDPDYNALAAGAKAAGVKMTDYVRRIFAEERRHKRALYSLTGEIYRRAMK